jgi:hypothetical protein
MRLIARTRFYRLISLCEAPDYAGTSVKALQKASVEQPTRTVTENRDFFRNVGSNLALKDGTIFSMPRDARQDLIKYISFARPSSAHVPCAPILAAKSTTFIKNGESGILGPLQFPLRRS